jgi:exonuclease III
LQDPNYEPAPVAFDFVFVFVSQDLAARVNGMDVDQATRDSDHQPLLLSLG